MELLFFSRNEACLEVKMCSLYF